MYRKRKYTADIDPAHTHRTRSRSKRTKRIPVPIRSAPKNAQQIVLQDTSKHGNPMQLIFSFLYWNEIVKLKRVDTQFAYQVAQPYVWEKLSDLIDFKVVVPYFLETNSFARNVLSLTNRIHKLTNGMYTRQILGGESWNFAINYGTTCIRVEQGHNCEYCGRFCISMGRCINVKTFEFPLLK